LLLFESEEMPDVPIEDVRDVSRDVAAMQHGLDRRRGGFPVSLRLRREIHGILLARGRGGDKEPGEFRRRRSRRPTPRVGCWTSSSAIGG